MPDKPRETVFTGGIVDELDEHIEQIRNNDPDLTELDLTGFEMSEAQRFSLIEALNINTYLQKLTLDPGQTLPDNVPGLLDINDNVPALLDINKDIARLAANDPELTDLDLTGRGVTYEQYQALRKALVNNTNTALETLTLDLNTGYKESSVIATDDMNSVLSRNTTLRELTIFAGSAEKVAGEISANLLSNNFSITTLQIYALGAVDGLPEIIELPKVVQARLNFNQENSESLKDVGAIKGIQGDLLNNKFWQQQTRGLTSSSVPRGVKAMQGVLTQYFSDLSRARDEGKEIPTTDTLLKNLHEIANERLGPHPDDTSASIFSKTMGRIKAGVRGENSPQAKLYEKVRAAETLDDVLSAFDETMKKPAVEGKAAEKAATSDEPPGPGSGPPPPPSPHL